MFKDQKVVVVMPAHSADRTLRRTDDETMAREIVDVVVVVDDASRDETVSVAAELPDATVLKYYKNKGYGTYRFESI